MSPKKFLSNKRTTHQTISISPALKDWITRFVNKNNNKLPDDERFKSISAFYNFVMENVLEIFEMGKTLDDLKNFPDENINKFFEQFSFRGILPLHEEWVKANKYTRLNIKSIMGYLIAARSIYFSNVDPYNLESVQAIFERFTNYFKKNKITKEFKLSLETIKKSHHLIAQIEHRGTYRVLQFENIKFLAIIFGFLGVKIEDFVYSEQEMYFRLDIITTPLFFNNKLKRKDRINLADINLNYIINYNRILFDEDYYLWNKLANHKDVFISFKNYKSLYRIIEKIEDDHHKYSIEANLELKILKFFEKIHWIKINNEEHLSFDLTLSNTKNHQEIEELIKIISNYGNLTNSENTFYLNI